MVTGADIITEQIFFPESEYLNNIIKNMPQKLKGGSILIDNGDFALYVSITIISMIIFFCLFAVIKQLMKYCEGESFTGMDNDSQVWKISSVCTMIHHVVVISLFTYTFYYSCSNMNGSPIPSREGGTFTSLTMKKRWGFFKDEVCFMQPNKGYAISLFFCMGYSIYDLFLMCFWIEDRTTLIKQTIVHHYCMILGFIAALCGGYWTSGLATSALYSEVSSLFLNFLDMQKNKPNNIFVPIA